MCVTGTRFQFLQEKASVCIHKCRAIQVNHVLTLLENICITFFPLPFFRDVVLGATLNHTHSNCQLFSRLNSVAFSAICMFLLQSTDSVLTQVIFWSTRIVV